MKDQVEIFKINQHSNPQLYNEAFLLASEIFNENVDDVNYTKHKKQMWKYEPFVDNEMVIVACINDVVVAILRILDRKMIVSGKMKRVAGFTTICVRKEYRKQGLGSRLINASIEIIGKKGYDLAILVARKSLDYYYTKFGFWGVSSYNQIEFSLENFTPIKKLQIRKINNYADIKVADFERLYFTAYQNCSGMVLRNKKYWAYVFKKIEISRNLFIEVVYDLDTIVAYIIRDSEKIYELGLDGNKESSIAILSHYKNINITKYEISSDHHFLNDVSEFDIRITFRSCFYGGHMVRLIKKMSEDQDNAQYIPSYLETCKELEMSAIGINKGYSFNLAYMDQM